MVGRVWGVVRLKTRHGMRRSATLCQCRWLNGWHSGSRGPSALSTRVPLQCPSTPRRSVEMYIARRTGAGRGVYELADTINGVRPADLYGQELVLYVGEREIPT